jgi:hypothetical protein
VLPEQFSEANRDVDLPNVGEVGSGVKGDAKGGAYPEGPGYNEWMKFRGEDRGGRQEMMLSARKARD